MIPTESDIKHLQEALNGFVRGWPKLGLNTVIVDGQWGPATKKLNHDVRFLIGYLHDVDSFPDANFYRRVVHPEKLEPKWGQTAEVVKTGKKRQDDRRAAVLGNKIKAFLKPGVGKFDGIPVAKTAIPVLTWCRNNGWNGKLVSGYRTPAYSEHLCYNMCGAPTCPGRCAGRSTNHAYAEPYRFAVDVSDYLTFKSVVARCPLQPHIHNDLPSDPVHFSPSGH